MSRIWTRQPQTPVRIDRSSSLARGLQAGILTSVSMSQDVVNPNQVWAPTSKPPILQLGAFGKAAYFDNTGTNALVVGSNPVGGTDMTMACMFRADTTTAQALMSVSQSGGTSRFNLIVNTPSIGNVIANSFDGATVNAVASKNLTVGKWHLAIVRRVNGVAVDASVDGLKPVSAAIGSTGIAGANRLVFGARYSTTLGAFFQGAIQDPLWWSRAISDDECQDLFQAYWRVYDMPSERIFLGPPTAAPATFNPAWARNRTHILGAGVR